MANIYLSSVAYAAVTQWSASLTATVGMIRRQLATPSAGNERCWRCTTAGTTGATEPTWSLTANSTTNDNGVVWTECTGQAAYNGDTTGTAWGAPHARLSAALSFSAAGDTIFAASNHAESWTAAITTTIPGTQSARTRILSVDETLVPATNLTALKSGASLTTSSGLVSIVGSSATTGCGAFQGVSYTHSQAATVNMLVGQGNTDLYFESCKFQLTGNTTGSFIAFGQTNPATNNRLRLRNCSVKFANTGQYLLLRSAQSVVQNLSFETGSLIPTTLFQLFSNNYGGIEFLLLDSDLSSLSSNNLFSLSNTGNNFVNFQMRNCKISSNLGLPTTVNRPGYRFRMDNCDSGGTNIRFYQLDFSGTVESNTTTTVTGLSAKMMTNNNVAWEAPMEFELPPVKVQAGVPVTLQWNIASPSTLTNSDVWIEIDYPATSGSTQGSIVSTGMTNILGTPSNIASLYANWSGSPANIYTKSASFTPAVSGWALPVIKVAKKSATVYVDLGGASLVPGDGFSLSNGLIVHPGMGGGMRG